MQRFMLLIQSAQHMQFQNQAYKYTVAVELEFLVQNGCLNPTESFIFLLSIKLYFINKHFHINKW